MNRRVRLLIFLVVCCLVPAVVAASWLLTDTVLRATSDESFCSNCHSMKPFAMSYAADVHGGRNPHGLAATCVACHLPHDSSGHYLTAKIRTGFQDVWSEIARLFREPDWIGNLDKRASYVYDSGCRTCHARLETAVDRKPIATASHQAYFAGKGTTKCVTCHSHVGHKDLIDHLSADQTKDSQEAASKGTSP